MLSKVSAVPVELVAAPAPRAPLPFPPARQRAAAAAADLPHSKWPRWSTPICPHCMARRQPICSVRHWGHLLLSMSSSSGISLATAAAAAAQHSIGAQQPRSIIISCNGSSDAVHRCHCHCHRRQLRVELPRQRLQHVLLLWLLLLWQPKGSSARPSCIGVTVFARQALPACRPHPRRTRHRRLHRQRQRPLHWQLPRIMAHSRLRIII